jgi:hypothetical protein
MFILFRHPHFNRTKVLYFSSNNKRLREEKERKKKRKEKIPSLFCYFLRSCFRIVDETLVKGSEQGYTRISF